MIITFYEIGFNNPLSKDAVKFNWFVTGMFGMDILLSFNTGYINEETGQFVANPKLIAWKYLSFWFWIDFLATISWDALIPLFIDGHVENLMAIRTIRFLRLFRLSKISKVLSKEGFISKLKINPQILQLFILIIELFFIAHVFACLWQYVALPENSSHYFTTWVKKFEFENEKDRVRYLTALYYIIVTMLTIGYGDIYPTNQAERIVAILTMLVGVIVFSTLMSKVANLLNKMNPQAHIMKEKMEELKSFLVEINLPRHLRQKAQIEYEHYFEKKAVLDEVGLDGLAKPMLMPLLYDIYHADVQAISLFHEVKSNSFIFTVALAWNPCFAVAGDVLYGSGDILKKIIFIKEGAIRISEVIKDNRTSSTITQTSYRGTSILLGGFYSGNFFGDMEYVKNSPSLAHYSAVLRCHLFSVNHSVVTQFLSEDQTAGERLMKIFQNRYEAMRKLLRDQKVVEFNNSTVKYRNLELPIKEL